MDSRWARARSSKGKDYIDVFINKNNANMSYNIRDVGHVHLGLGSGSQECFWME